MDGESLESQTGFDLSELRRTEFSSEDGSVHFEIRRMPTTKAMRFINSIRAEMGQTDRAVNAMSASLTTINLIENAGSLDPSKIGGQEMAAMAQSFFSMLFGFSEYFVDQVVRRELSGCIYYRSQKLTGGNWLPLWDGEVDNTDEVTDDWAFGYELMARSFVVNFTDSSRLLAWTQKARAWVTSQSKPSESTP